MTTREMFMVITGERDSLGRAPFDLYWSDAEGKRRGQCFRAVPEQYIERGAVLVSSEAEAKKLAWGAS